MTLADRRPIGSRIRALLGASSVPSSVLFEAAVVVLRKTLFAGVARPHERLIVLLSVQGVSPRAYNIFIFEFSNVIINTTNVAG